MLRALASTGGVVTSAGILLAAVFAVLGVLLDPLVVRHVLVPALALLLGDRFWWPGHPDGPGPTVPQPAASTASAAR